MAASRLASTLRRVATRFSVYLASDFLSPLSKGNNGMVGHAENRGAGVSDCLGRLRHNTGIIAKTLRSTRITTPARLFSPDGDVRAIAATKRLRSRRRARMARSSRATGATGPGDARQGLQTYRLFSLRPSFSAGSSRLSGCSRARAISRAGALGRFAHSRHHGPWE